MLSLRRLGIDAYRENIAFLRRDCPVVRAGDFMVLNRVEIFALGPDGRAAGSRIRATLNLVDPGSVLQPAELGVSDEAFRQLGLVEGSAVGIEPASPPASADALHAKIMGRSLSEAELRLLVTDVVANRYSKMEIAAFVVAAANAFSRDEVLALTRAMIDAGVRLDWGADGHGSRRMIVDKHSIGGIPGNRTSMIVVPIVAAHGLYCPKTSSRAITSPAGTADTMEVLARVELDAEQMRQVVEREHGCLVWGGHVNLSPADDIFIAVERPLSIDSAEQMVASILSKKAAAGVTHLVLDLPVGPTAKLRSAVDATALRKLFEYVADAVGLQVEVVYTDGSQPIGRGIGPALEARDVMAVLRNEADAPLDLRDKALLLAGHMLEFDPALRGGGGLQRARQLLASGDALRAMQHIMAAQGPPPATIEPAKLTVEIAAPHDGIIAGIDCLRLARIARLAGAPFAKGAGIDLLVKAGARVVAGQPLYRLHAALASDLNFAVAYAALDNAYKVTT
ncbi:MAG: thymidine phosphorylase family protein [Rhodospirillales bacterium]